MMLITLDNLGKFEPKGDEGYFLGYSMSSKAFRVFNKRTKRVEENVHIEFLENKAIGNGSGPNWLFNINSLTKSINYVPVVDAGTTSTNFSEHLESISSQPQEPCNTDAPESSGNSNPTSTSTNPSGYQVETLTVESSIPTVSSPVPTVCFTDSQEPSSKTRLISKKVTNQAETPSLDNILTLINQFEDTLGDPSLLQFCLFSCFLSQVEPKKISDALQDLSWVEATKWVLKNKKDERGIVIKNKVRLVAQGHTQEEGIDYDEVFAPVARIEAIRLFLAYASFMDFVVYQLDVKSSFLYGTIDEEVGTIDQTLFIRKQREDFILVQVYVDDIIFGSSNPQLCREFEAFMHEKFQMSAMGELNFFLGLQVLQKEDGIFLSQDKYVGDILKKFGYTDVRLNMTLEAFSREFSTSILRLYALTVKPTVYVSHIRQFWSTAKIETTEEGTKILAAVDGIVRSVFESSLRSNLKLRDEDGISSIVPFFDVMLVSQGEGSGTPTEPHHTPSSVALTHSHTTQPTSLLPPVSTTSIPTVTPTETTPIWQYTSRVRIAQSSALPPVADEP
nr:hypothetical protein [Tanacetum cinerariifolium]